MLIVMVRLAAVVLFLQVDAVEGTCRDRGLVIPTQLVVTIFLQVRTLRLDATCDR